MTRNEQERLEQLLRGGAQTPPPPALLDRLKQDIPLDVRSRDPRAARRERYFNSISPWLAAASIAMLFTFTFLISRITILDPSPEPDFAAVLERQQREATKVSESAADHAPIGASAKRRPPEVTETDSPAPAAQPAAATVSSQAAKVEQAESFSTAPMEAEPDSSLTSANAPREEMILAPAAPPPPAARAVMDRQDVRAALVETARLDAPLVLPAELRASFTIDSSGTVTSVTVDSELNDENRSAVESALRRWIFEAGRPSSFELLIRTEDLQPR